MNTPDLLLLFSNKQRRTDKIFRHLSNDTRPLTNPRYFTYLISSKGIKFGSINDGLEYGTAHLHLIEESNEEIIIAGEIKISGSDLYYNFASGSISLQQSKNDPNKFKINLLKARKLCETIFTLDDNITRITYMGNNITATLFKFDDPYPSSAELDEICKDPQVQLYKSTYINSPDKMCTNNSITTLKDPEVKAAFTNLGVQLSTLNIRNELNIKVDDTVHYKNYCLNK